MDSADRAKDGERERMTERMTPLSRDLFRFEREADRLNAELRKLTTLEGADLQAASELRQYLSLIARRSANVASRLSVAAEQKGKEAA